MIIFVNVRNIYSISNMSNSIENRKKKHAYFLMTVENVYTLLAICLL